VTTAVSWSVDGSRQADAVDSWQKQVSHAQLPWQVSVPDKSRFAASVRYRHLDRLRIAEFRVVGMEGRRPENYESGDGGDHVGVLINLAGQMVCRYDDGEVVALGPGELLLWDSKRAHGFDAIGPAHDLSLLVPRCRVPKELVKAAERSTTAIRASAGTGLVGIAAEQLRAITRELAHLTDRQLSVACGNFIDTLDVAVNPVVSEARQTARASLVDRVSRYVELHLDDVDLSPTAIAAAHDVSVRTLHLAFGETGTTVSRLIRDKRLHASYRDLVRAGRGSTVTDIAYRWGFSDAPHFSRSFKLAFGVSPSKVLAG
jgi:AraC-like DNA-binding protein